MNHEGSTARMYCMRSTAGTCADAAKRTTHRLRAPGSCPGFGPECCSLASSLSREIPRPALVRSAFQETLLKKMACEPRGFHSFMKSRAKRSGAQQSAAERSIATYNAIDGQRGDAANKVAICGAWVAAAWPWDTMSCILFCTAV